MTLEITPGDVFVVKDRTDLTRPRTKFVTAFSGLRGGKWFEGIPSADVPAVNPETKRAFQPKEVIFFARTYALPWLMHTVEIDNVATAVGQQPSGAVADLQKRALDGLIARETKVGTIETVRGVFSFGIGYQCLFDNGRPGIIATVGGNFEAPTQIKIIVSDNNKKYSGLEADQKFRFDKLRLKLITPDRLDEIGSKPSNLEQVLLALRSRLTENREGFPSAAKVIGRPTPPV